MSTLITNIAELMTQDAEHRVLKDAAVVIEGERISWIGPPSGAPAADDVVDAGRRALLPGWVDSHTHLIFAGDRTAEFEARMAGRELQRRGHRRDHGGHPGTSDVDLTRLAQGRVAEAVSPGHYLPGNQDRLRPGPWRTRRAAPASPPPWRTR